MAMKCVVTGAVPAWAMDEFKTLGVNVEQYGIKDFLDEGEFKKRIADADVFVCGGFEEMTKPVFLAAKKLQLVVFLGTDWEKYIDGAAASERGVTIRNTPGANANAVAEFTVGLMIAAQRNLFSLTSAVRDGRWSSHFGSELGGAKVGLIGLGAVGGRVASILRHGFGANVAYVARTRKQEVERRDGIEWKSLDDIVGWADIVSLHVPSTAAAGGPVINGAVFAKMGKGKILINTAPPSLVDGQALREAISSGTVARAVFDTFYIEGDKFAEASERDLLQLGADKFVVSPHVAWKTTETDERTFRAAMDIIKGHLKRG